MSEHQPPDEQPRRTSKSQASRRPTLDDPGAFYDRRPHYGGFYRGQPNREGRHDWAAALRAAQLAMAAELRRGDAPKHRISTMPKPAWFRVRLVSSAAIADMGMRTGKPIAECIREIDGVLPNTAWTTTTNGHITGFKVAQREHPGPDGETTSTTRLNILVASRELHDQQAAATATAYGLNPADLQDTPPDNFVEVPMAEGHGFLLPPDFVGSLETKVNEALGPGMSVRFGGLPEKRPA